MHGDQQNDVIVTDARLDDVISPDSSSTDDVTDDDDSDQLSSEHGENSNEFSGLVQ